MSSHHGCPCGYILLVILKLVCEAKWLIMKVTIVLIMSVCAEEETTAYCHVMHHCQTSTRLNTYVHAPTRVVRRAQCDPWSSTGVQNVSWLTADISQQVQINWTTRSLQTLSSLLLTSETFSHLQPCDWDLHRLLFFANETTLAHF